MNLKLPSWLRQPGSTSLVSRCLRLDRLDGWIALLAILAAATPGHAQYYMPGIIEPQALRLQVNSGYLGFRVDANREEAKYSNGAGTTTFDRLFGGPVLGLNADGSIYHPNFIKFTLSGEISPGYDYERSNSALLANRKQLSILGNYFANFAFLTNKPYHFNLFLSQNYSYRDYDFFNRVEVDTVRYGGNIAYNSGPVPLNLSVWRRSEDTIGQVNNSSLVETGITLDARHKRRSGETSFSYSLDDLSRTDGGVQAADTTHSFGLADTATFGSHDQMLLSTNLGYINRQSPTDPTDDINASTNLTVQHSKTLTSFYDANYFRSTSNSGLGSTTTDNLSGGISLRHQLFKSLTSLLRVQGQGSDSTGDFVGVSGANQTTTQTNNRYGVSLTEQYTKRLGSIGRLTMIGSIGYEHSVVDNSGNVLIITDERHQFSTAASGNGTDSFFLNLPFVDETTILVTDDHHSLPAYQLGRDYTVTNNGSLVMIRRTPGSTIPQTSTVLVDYRAQASASGEYDTVTGMLDVRIDLWKGLLSIFGRINSVQNNAAPELLVQNMSLRAVGAETTWRWLHAGVEYETNDSTFSSYRNTRLYQNLSFRPDAYSTLGLSFNESQTQYIDAGRTEQNYSVMTNYQRRFGRRLGIHLDAGVSVRKGIGVDQTLIAVRPTLDYTIGRFELKVGYSYESGKYQNIYQRQNNMLFISGRRNF